MNTYKSSRQQEVTCKNKNVFYTRNGSMCKYLIKHGKTSKREPLPRKTMFSSNYTTSQINVCINARTINIQPALHDSLYVTTCNFRQLKFFSINCYSLYAVKDISPKPFNANSLLSTQINRRFCILSLLCKLNLNKIVISLKFRLWNQKYFN